ncbi:MAG: protein kinase [Verrucomicrobiota bacterium]
MNSGVEPDPKAQTPPEFRPPEHPEPPVIPDHQLLQCIGRGSYGEVWLARSVTGAYRAVKIVYRQDFDHERPFEREFSGILKFEPVSRKHDSQMDILHVGRGADYFFYVMELADDQFTGQQINPDAYAPKSLKSEMFNRGKLPFEECVQISLSLTTALENLHSEGLVHRDIKPSNVIYVNGVVKLADIGLVTSVDASRSFVGTEGFVPPEGPGTPQADLYSLGKLLYELCTGKDRQEFPELPANLDAWPDREGLLELNAAIAKACREDPGQRYPSAQAMHKELLLLQSGKSLARLHAAQRSLAKVKRVAVAASAVVLVLAAGLSLATTGWRQARLLANFERLSRKRLADDQTQWPNDPAQWTSNILNLVGVLDNEHKYAEVDKLFESLLPSSNMSQSQRANALAYTGYLRARSGRFDEAAADLKRMVEADPSEPWGWYVLAPLLIQSGQIAEYQSHCKALLNRFGTTSDPIAGGRAAKACLLYPSAVGPEELKLANKLADNVVASGENSPFLPWYQLTKGLAEYRQGHFASAARWMERIQKEPKLDDLPDTCRADTYLVLAMARRQLNQSDEARVALARGLEIVRTKLPKLDSGDLGEWYDVLMTYILMREAKEIAEGPHDGELE